jgi:hypothetical protein
MEGLRIAGLLGMNGLFEPFVVKFEVGEPAFEVERVYRA